MFVNGAGVRCWSVDLDVSVLDQQLKLFVSRHSAFLSEHVPGEILPTHTYTHADTHLRMQAVLVMMCSHVDVLVLLDSPVQGTFQKSCS